MKQLLEIVSNAVLILAKASMTSSLLVNELDIANTNGNSITDVII
jgi:hypothetical protein